MTRKPLIGALALFIGSSLILGCSRTQAVTPQELREKYGIDDASTGQVTTAEGKLRATLVPTSRPNHRAAEI